jgi:betaine-aldehyde dehydrogenase
MKRHLSKSFRTIKRGFASDASSFHIPSVLTSWVDGASVPVTETATRYENRSPVSGETICQVQTPTSETVETAIASARQAGKTGPWSALGFAERGKILQEMAQILKQNQEELCYLEALDSGIPIAQLRAGHAPYAIQTLEYYAALATTGMPGKMVDVPLAGGHKDSFAYTRREPLGVCAAIGGWNYPLVTMTWKIAPALACGNTILFKPSECTPITSLHVAQLWSDILPPGVLQVLPGEAETAQSLVAHPMVQKVSITGSTATGIKVAKNSADTLKRLTLELGGKSPLLIFKDSNLKSAVRVAIEGNFINNGQVCSNCTRVFVERSILDEFIVRVVEQLESSVKLGDNLLDETNMGPLIMPPRKPSGHYDRVMGFIERAKDHPSVRLIYGGKGLEQNGGYYVEPTVLLCDTDDVEIVQEEVFGPVMTILPFDTEEEAVTRANSTDYGLGAGVMTKDVMRAHRLSKVLEAGNVWVNNWNLSPVEVSSNQYCSSLTVSLQLVLTTFGLDLVMF